MKKATRLSMDTKFQNMKFKKEIMCMECRVHGIETFGCDDGYGVRYIVFLQGCQGGCIYCHNVSSWNFNGGEVMDTDDIIKDMVHNKEFYKPNKGGITISGGEALNQLDACIDLARKTHLQGLTVALDTTGLISLKDNEDKIVSLLRYVDCVLMDLKAGTDEMHDKLCKFKLQRAKEFATLCDKMGVEIWIRHVVLKGFNAESDYDLWKILGFVKTLHHVTRFDLLPFHNMGEYKWNECGIKYTLSDDNVPDEDDMIRKAELAESILLGVKVTR